MNTACGWPLDVGKTVGCDGTAVGSAVGSTGDAVGSKVKESVR